MLLSVVVLLCFEIVGGISTRISNVIERRDVNGDLMDIHDGNLFLDPKNSSRFLWFGMGYTDFEESKGWIPPKDCPGIYETFGKGCGFLENHAVRLYSSDDLSNFTLMSENVFTNRPEGIYFRPKVIYNKKTDKYVLWINYLPPKSTPLQSYPDATFIVAMSSEPEGPYQVVTEKANISETGGGDFTVMIDPKDDVAYLAYDAWGNNHKVLIEELNENYTDSLGAATSTGPLSPSSHEAPILFERKGIYFLMYVVLMFEVFFLFFFLRSLINTHTQHIRTHKQVRSHMLLLFNRSGLSSHDSTIPQRTLERHELRHQSEARFFRF